MAEVNPFELQPQQPFRMPQTTITPQEGALSGGPEGSYFALSPQAMQMMWAPQQQPLTPQLPQQIQPSQVQLPPLPPV